LDVYSSSIAIELERSAVVELSAESTP